MSIRKSSGLFKKMDDDLNASILSRKVKNTKKQTLKPYRKKFYELGETPYDFSSRKRAKCGYSTKKDNHGNLSTDLDQLSPSQSSEDTSQFSEATPSQSVVGTSSQFSTTIESTLSQSTEVSHQTSPVQLDQPIADNDTSSVLLLDQCILTAQDEAFLNEDQLYMNILCIEGTQSVSVSDGLGLFMVLPDMDFSKSQLKKEHFILLQRKAMCFPQTDAKWICTCSCQPIWSIEIMSSSCSSLISHEELMAMYPPCIHRRVGSVIYEQYDNLQQFNPRDYFIINPEDTDHGYSANSPEIEEATKNGLVPVLRVWSSSLNTHGLVSVVKKKFICFCCNKNYCDHVKRIRYLAGQNLENDIYPHVLQELIDVYNAENETPLNSLKQKIKCHSRKKISFNPTEKLTQIFSSGIVNNIQKNDENMVFIPKDTNCQHCDGELDCRDPIAHEWIAHSNATIVTYTYLGTATVYYRPCLNCDSVTLFDGQENCFLNMGSYLVGYDILRSYMHSFLHGRRPLYTFYSVFVEDHCDYGNKTIMENFSYHKLRAAWLSFLRLLDIDFEQGFSCPDCPGDNGPDIIICDGTSLSFQRRMWSWKSPEMPKNTSSKKKSGFKDRVFITEEKTRKLLHRFAVGGDLFRGKQIPVLSIGEKKELLNLLEEYPALNLFIKSVDNGTVKLPKMFSDFITSIASKSPVCGYIHPSQEIGQLIHELIKGVEVKSNNPLWQNLHNNIPVLFELLRNTNGDSAPVELRPLLAELWDVAMYPFDNCEVIDDSTFQIEEPEMSFFPSLPTCRPRGSYNMDAKKNDNSCGKKYKGHPSLLPGVFTFYCPHGVCYGFQVMPTMESPNVPFTILRTRFKTAPRVVVYDNACALHAYCMNRDPTFFKNTIFLVDRLHWDNHVGCSCGYCLALYPTLTELNSQTNEQANAGLKRIKDQLSYMTAENFMEHCCFYLWDKNMKKIEKATH